MDDMKPTVGRIVHYTPANVDGGAIGEDPVEDDLPAIVTRVHNENTVTLAVFAGDSISVPVRIFPSVEHSEERKTRTWRWPPRV